MDSTLGVVDPVSECYVCPQEWHRTNASKGMRGFPVSRCLEVKLLRGGQILWVVGQAASTATCRRYPCPRSIGNWKVESAEARHGGVSDGTTLGEAYVCYIKAIRETGSANVVCFSSRDGGVRQL